MDHDKKKKTNKNKSRRPIFNRPSLGTIGVRGNIDLRPRPLPRPQPKDFGYNTQQKHLPKEEKSHWNGKVEMWTEPQKPRQEKIVKYEVDTDKLLRELAEGNKEALNEITEKIEKEMKSEPTQATENKTDVAEKSTEDLEASEVSEETEREEKKQTNESPEQAETDLQNEKSETEKSENETQHEEAEPQPENVNDESQEVLQDTEPESNPQEEPFNAPELIYMNPSFWEQLESEMSDELEQLEPEENLEMTPEEGEPFEEGY